MTNVVVNFIASIIKILFQICKLVMDPFIPRSSKCAEVELVEMSTEITDLRCIELDKCIERRLKIKETLKQIILNNVYPLTSSQKNLVESVKLKIQDMRLEDAENDYRVLKMGESFDGQSSNINGDIFKDKDISDAMKGLKTSYEQFVSKQKVAKSILVEIEVMLGKISSQQRLKTVYNVDYAAFVNTVHSGPLAQVLLEYRNRNRV